MEGRWLGATSKQRRRRTSPRQSSRRGSRHGNDDDDVVSLANCAQGRGRRRRGPALGGSVRRKVRELRRLVPGGRELGSDDQLLSRTADYIHELRMQVHVLRALSKLYVP